MDRERAQLIEHVRTVQREVRTCDGCGLCCTEAYNSVRILPTEAARIAAHLGTLPGARREALVARIGAAIKRFRLEPRLERQPYTCPFLEPDFTCTLPFDVKPVACLAFNPVDEDHCEMDVDWFERARGAQARANGKSGESGRRFPIPVAVVRALDSGDEARARTKDVKTPGPSKPHPLPRLLSKWHVASRSVAETLVRSGRVTVNGTVVKDILRMVKPGRDRIAVDGAPVGPPAPAAYAYVALNKPRGVVTTTKDPEGRQTVMDLLGGGVAAGLAPVGRLDQDSAGLILLTNDHQLAARLLDPASHVAKMYRVKVKGRASADTLDRMRTERVEVDGLSLEPFGVEIESVGPRSTWLRITLEEGKNRQIRRQCEAFGHEVEMIVRMKFGPLELGALKPGASRPLAPAEVEALRRAR
jgi:23S rRNA pseudouridine2605 synthase